MTPPPPRSSPSSPSVSDKLNHENNNIQKLSETSFECRSPTTTTTSSTSTLPLVDEDSKNNNTSNFKLLSISFIAPSPPKEFGNSYDHLTTKFDEQQQQQNEDKYKKPTRIFVQSFENDQFFACAGRFLSAERFLDLLERSSYGDVFVFSGTCKIFSEIDEEKKKNNNHEEDDAYLWFSGASSTEPGRWVSGLEIAQALSKGNGHLFLNCDYACFVARHQHYLVSSKTCSSSSCTSLLSLEQQLSLAMSPIIISSSPYHHQQQHQNHHHHPLSFMIKNFRTEFAIPFIEHCCDFSRISCHFSKSATSSSKCNNFKMIPLSCGSIHQEEEQEELVESLLIKCLFKKYSRHLKLSDFHNFVSKIKEQKQNQNEEEHFGGPVIWSDSMILTRFEPHIAAHQQAIVDMYESNLWRDSVGTHMESRDHARQFLENRPQKMFHEVGTGSFAVVVPIKKEKKKECDQDEKEEEYEHKIVGMFGAILRPEMDGDFDLGVGLHPDFVGKGYATKAANMILTWARKALGLRRIRSITGTNNESALKLLEGRLGFKKMFDGEAKYYSWKEPNYVLVKELK